MNIYDFLIRRLGAEGTTWVQREAFNLETATELVRYLHPGCLIIEAKLVS